MKVSIVVPAYNEEKLIADSLEAIQAAQQSFAALGWESELIVCDNNSTDRTAHLAQAHGAQVVFEPVNQIARARNRGAQAAQGEWLIFVDADSRPSPGLFADVAQQIQSGECLAGGSTIRMDESHLLGNLIVGAWNVLSRLNRWAAGSFIFCDTAAFRRVGGFNQELFASEELDLSRRLKRLAKAQGKRLVILHRHPLLTSARKMRLYSRWEYARFLWQMILHPSETLRRRESCPTWYDGRR